MPRYRADLPQFVGGLFLTDGGIETTLIFPRRLALPAVCGFPSAESAGGAGITRDTSPSSPIWHGARGQLHSWRAPPGAADWGDNSATGQRSRSDANRRAVALLQRHPQATRDSAPRLWSSAAASARAATATARRADDAPTRPRRYHSLQATTFADADADMVTAITMTYPARRSGLTRAAPAPPACRS